MKLLYLLSGLCFVNGYGYNSHEYLGGISDKYLSLYESVIYSKIFDLTNGSLSSISSWADKVKRSKQYSWTSTLHYIDILECKNNLYNKEDINKYCKDKCIISIIKDLTNSLKYNSRYVYKINYYNSTLSRSEQLKFLVHFLQDFNQPMHLLGYDRGGNSLKVNMYKNGRNRTTNLHYVWDSLLPEHYIKNYAYTVPFEKVILEKNFTVDLLLENMLNVNINVSCNIYPKKHEDINYLIFDDYFNDSHFKLLFDNYHNMATKILKYIFE